MASPIAVQDVAQADTRSSAGTTAVIGIAFTIAVVHLLTNGRYGFHRDELQTLLLHSVYNMYTIRIFLTYCKPLK